MNPALSSYGPACNRKWDPPGPDTRVKDAGSLTLCVVDLKLRHPGEGLSFNTLVALGKIAFHPASGRAPTAIQESLEEIFSETSDETQKADRFVLQPGSPQCDRFRERGDLDRCSLGPSQVQSPHREIIPCLLSFILVI